MVVILNILAIPIQDVQVDVLLTKLIIVLLGYIKEKKKEQEIKMQ
jgi:hypothetical protein